MRDGEHLFAFLDDIYTATLPDSVGAVHACVGDELKTRANIHIHGGKTKVWNQASMCSLLGSFWCIPRKIGPNSWPDHTPPTLGARVWVLTGTHVWPCIQGRLPKRQWEVGAVVTWSFGIIEKCGNMSVYQHPSPSPKKKTLPLPKKIA